MAQLISSSAAVAAAATTAGALYLDGKYNISRDIQQLLSDRRWRKRMQNRIDELGEHVHSYRMYQLAKQDVEALWFEGRGWTYAEALNNADSLAEVLYHQGIRCGDFVAVFMTNSPEFVFTLLALAKIGAIPALLNVALRNETLLHCMNIANTTKIIATADLVEHLDAIVAGKEDTVTLFQLNIGSFAGTTKQANINITDQTLGSVATNDVPIAVKNITDIAALIYTSGTSGKPKAVSIKTILFVITSTPLCKDIDKSPGDIRIYSCLPLFHGTCIFTAFMYGVGSSGTFCLARKFSASGFSAALKASRADRMLYVGELCRYLLKAPPSPHDRTHNCRIASGNGLQGDIWQAFQKRFNIDEIREFYRSTEGIAKFDNFAGGPAAAGKCGFAGPIYRFFNDVTYLVRFDPVTQGPWRDPGTGFCVPARLGEPGEAIGRVASMATYHDYLGNPEANEKKLIRDVFKKGDVFQRSGDLLLHSKDGWIKFVERAGDSYRWKGENVSAGEVKDHITKSTEVQDCEVYGTILDRYDGQAGAAAVILHNPALQEQFMSGLYEKLRTQGLTEYQVPRLVRFIPAMSVNATFKNLKTELKTLTWDPLKQRPGEGLWVLNGSKYVRLDENGWRDVQSGQARL
ncbi:bifunctional fatty acid transporter and acyl-CoA synthetase [Microthyrium microscopicum]|uniref:Bifunctional fatty acid transporter and acyl-CoA synthetase n=1 Tax=Microthyrium microscopicum TaxID=703497 RepID=A0A6A6UBY5_9PEZI|nr:bifunctional fatty acid transporter and acyl-CoA synthetase [Microthyrium microscopicum]